MKVLTTDATQRNVTPATLDRRIRRASLMVDDAQDRHDVAVLRLDGYLSERAAAAGESPRTIIVAALTAWTPGTGRTSVRGVTTDTMDEGDTRTLNLYKASRVTVLPRSAHVALRAAACAAAAIAATRAQTKAMLAGDIERAAVDAMTAREYTTRAWEYTAG